MIESLQNFTAGLPHLLQWLGVMLAGVIPFVESYFGSVIGVAAGVNPIVAVAAAAVGNTLSMLAFVFAAGAVRERVVAEPTHEQAPRRKRLRAAFDRYGVAGVSLLGQTILPSQFTATALVSFGAPRERVVLWQTISIVLWGIVFGVLATFGIGLVRPS